MPDEQDKMVSVFVVKSNWVTEPQIRECMQIQDNFRENGEIPPSLLEILVERDYLSSSQKEAVLKELAKQGPRLFGAIAVALKFVSPDQVQECLEIQKRMRSRNTELDGFSTFLGEIMVSKNYLQEKQVHQVLKAQKQEAQEKQVSICKHCGTQFNAKLISAGKKLKCGKCGQVLESAGTSAVEAQAVPADLEVEQTVVRAPKKKSALTLSLPQLRRKKKIDIPGYQILDTLGEDGVSITYKAAYNLDKSKVVVIKLYNEEVSGDKEFMSKVERYVKHSASLNIPNVRKNFGTGNFRAKAGNVYSYVVSEFIEGDSLHRIIKQKVEISLEKAVKIITRLAKMLQYAWSEGMYHGDIAAHNVLISQDNKVILLNLGVPTKVEKNIVRIAELDGVAPLYLAPEVAGNQVIDHRCDIYSLGALLYHILAYKPAFDGQSPFDILNRMADDIPLPPIWVYNPNVSQELFKIMEKMMAPDLEQRYKEYEELIADLKNPQQIDAHVQATVTEELKDEGDQTGEEEEEGVKLRASMRVKPRVPWGKIIFVSLLLLVIGWYTYSTLQYQGKVTAAKNRFFDLQMEYEQAKRDPGRLAEMEKKFAGYINQYRDLEFSDEKENTVKSAQYILEELERNTKIVSEDQINANLDEANRAYSSCHYWAALTQLEKVPSYLVDANQGTLNGHRKAFLKNAAQQADSLIKDVLAPIAKLEEEGFPNFAIHMDAISNSIKNIENYLDTAIDKDGVEELKALREKAEQNPQHPLAQKISDEGLESFAREMDRLDPISPELAKILLDTICGKLEETLSQSRSKLAKYRQLYHVQESAKSAQALDDIAHKVKNFKAEYNYNKAMEEVQKRAAEVTVSELSKQLQELQWTLEHLVRAKDVLVRSLEAKTDHLKVYIRDKAYTVERAGPDAIILIMSSKPGTQKTIEWRDFPRDRFPMLVEFASKNAGEIEQFSLGVFCVELEEYQLAWDILKNIPAKNEEAAAYLGKLKTDLANRSQELLDKIQKADLKDRKQWEANIQSALAIKNRYMLANLGQYKENERVLDSFFQKIFVELFGHETEPNFYCDFGVDSQETLKNEQQEIKMVPPASPLRVENGQLYLKSSWGFTGKDIRGVCGLCRFTEGNQMLDIDFGAYSFQITNTGQKVVCNSRKSKPPIHQEIEVENLGTNRWVLFGLFIANDTIHWYIDSKSVYSLPYKGESMTQFSFRVKGNICLDNLYLGGR